MSIYMDKIITFLVNLGTTVGLRILYALIVLTIGLKLSKYLVKLICKGKLFTRLDISIQSFTKSFLKVTLDILVFITVAVILGIPTTSFITILASAGVAIGLALQGSLSNLAGGLMILFFKPFTVGDYIETSTVGGNVIDISVFYTRLVTFDNKHITLPNGTLTNSSITNYSVEKTRRVDITFSVGYESDIGKVKDILYNCAMSNDLVLGEPDTFVGLIKQNNNSLDFSLRAWCNTPDYWTVYFQLNEDVKTQFDKNNISIPFPQLDVHMDEMNK